MRVEHQLLALTMLPGPAPDAEERIRSLTNGTLAWDYVLEAAARLGTLPLLSSALERSGARLPPVVEACGREARQLAAARALVAERELREINSAFESRQVPLLVLKGLPLAHELYGEPGLRPVGDLDLLVLRRFRDRGLSILEDLGYALPKGSLPPGFYRRHHFHAALVRPGRSGLPVELHWDIQPPFSLSHVTEEEIWAGKRVCDLDGLAIAVPGREDALLLLVQHLSRHALGLGGGGIVDPIAFLLDPATTGKLVWLSDLVLLLRSEPPLDWDRALSKARRWGLIGDLEDAAGILRRLDLLPAPIAARLPVESSSGGGQHVKSRSAARLLPALAKGSPLLQFRPIRGFDFLRYALPGGSWIRRRYGLERASGTEVWLRGVGHFLSANARALWMIAEAGIGLLTCRRRDAPWAEPRNGPVTRSARDNTLLGDCGEAIENARVSVQVTTPSRLEQPSVARVQERAEGVR